LGLLKTVDVFLGMRIPHSAVVFHDAFHECRVATGLSVSWACSHICLEESACGIRLVGSAVNVLLPASGGLLFGENPQAVA